MTNTCTAAEFGEWLSAQGACAEGRDWAAGNTPAAAWATCPRADWSLWAMARSGRWTPEQMVLAACLCAETALVYVPAGEERPRAAIETARRWARGEATRAEVAAAAWAASMGRTVSASTAAPIGLTLCALPLPFVLGFGQSAAICPNWLQLKAIYQKKDKP